MAADSFSVRSNRRRANPESMFYSYLTQPRFTAPRW